MSIGCTQCFAPLSNVERHNALSWELSYRMLQSANNKGGASISFFIS